MYIHSVHLKTFTDTFRQILLPVYLYTDLCLQQHDPHPHLHPLIRGRITGAAAQAGGPRLPFHDWLKQI